MYILNDKGIIYIELPSSKAANESLSRQEFYFEHFNIFSEKSFKILLKQLGYKVLYLKDIYEINKKYTIRAIISPIKFYKDENNKIKIKAAIIGMGIGQKHLEAINKYKGSKVLLIAKKIEKNFRFKKNLKIKITKIK